MRLSLSPDTMKRPSASRVAPCLLAPMAATALPEPVDVMGLPIRPLWIDQLVECLIARAQAGVRTVAAYANANTVNLAWSDPAFLQTLCAVDLLYADGMSVVLAGRLVGRDLPERMTAADYFDWFAARCADEGLPIFLLGGEAGVAETAATTLRSSLPSLNIAGMHHGYFDDAGSQGVIDAINASKARIVLAGMSSPRQETWALQNALRIDAPVIWCVGALFDYYAGREPRGPAWLCRNGGEWLYRLSADPLNKWRRYLIGNPMFAMRALGWAWKQRGAEQNRAEQSRDRKGAVSMDRDSTHTNLAITPAAQRSVANNNAKGGGTWQH